jgi:hypothetical protein
VAVLVGTLYHVVPFLVWDHRYADRVGYEPVPTVDDLYDARVARADLLGVALGGATLVGGASAGSHDAVVTGGLVVAAALVLAAGNLAGVVWVYAPVDWVGGGRADVEE